MERSAPSEALAPVHSAISPRLGVKSRRKKTGSLIAVPHCGGLQGHLAKKRAGVSKARFMYRVKYLKRERTQSSLLLIF
jgi:hypothetical protein